MILSAAFAAKIFNEDSYDICASSILFIALLVYLFHDFLVLRYLRMLSSLFRKAFLWIIYPTHAYKSCNTDQFS